MNAIMILFLAIFKSNLIFNNQFVIACHPINDQNLTKIKRKMRGVAIGNPCRYIQRALGR